VNNGKPPGKRGEFAPRVHSLRRAGRREGGGVGRSGPHPHGTTECELREAFRRRPNPFIYARPLNLEVDIDEACFLRSRGSSEGPPPPRATPTLLELFLVDVRCLDVAAAYTQTTTF